MDPLIYIPAGVPAGKLGVGLAFYGRQWKRGTSASNPNVGISGSYNVWSAGNAPTGGTELFYSEILNLSDDPGVVVQYDAIQEAPYLSHPGTPSTAWMVSYENPRSIQAKVQYVKAHKLGGWIIWGLWADYLPGHANPHPLLDAVGTASR